MWPQSWNRVMGVRSKWGFTDTLTQLEGVHRHMLEIDSWRSLHQPELAASNRPRLEISSWRPTGAKSSNWHEARSMIALENAIELCREGCLTYPLTSSTCR